MLGRQAELRLAVIPQEESGSFRTVDPARRDRPLRTPAARIQLVGAGIHHNVQRQVVVTWIRRRGVRPLNPAGAAMVHRLGHLTAIDSAAPPVAPGAPRRC